MKGAASVEMLLVKKFGGTSVGDKERIMNVARRCAKDWQEGNNIVMVLSAMGKQTDVLIDLAHEISPNPPKRELDMLLTTGEQTSVALMSMAFATMGIPAVSLNAFQVSMHTTRVYGNARIKRIDTDRIEHELESRKVVIVTGFQGVNKYDDYTTLGRGGSDTTAVALAAALHADSCEIFTDVDGVFTADPRIVKGARKIKEISYDEMLDLATLGAGVLHNRSVELAKKYNVPLIVRSSLNETEGTVIKEVAKVEGMLVSGVAADKNTTRVSVLGLEDRPGVAFRLFDLIAKKNINVDMILQSIGRDGTKDISFTVPSDDGQTAVETINDNLKSLRAKSVSFNDHVAKVSVVGAGMMSSPGVAARMFECLYNSDININMISTSEIRVTVLIDEKDTERALQAAHDAFGLED